MADCVSEIPMDLIPTKKNRTRKALKPKIPSENDTNIKAGMISSSPLSSLGDAGKENQEALYSGKKTKATTKKKSSEISFEKELEAMKGKFEQMRLEKEKTEELLKTRDEMLKQKEDELEIRSKEQEKLQVELKKLQKLKEFKPTMSLPLVQSLREKEQEKNEKTKKKKKKGEMKVKKPSPAYVLWCKDQWVEMKKENPDADFKEISNKLGAKWKTVTAEEKKPYEETYQADKEAYLLIVGQEKREIEAMKLLEEEQKQKTAMELLEQYLQFKEEAEKEETKKKKTKKQKDPLKPKHPLSAFFLFSSDRRAALFAEGKIAVEVAKIAGEEWKNMSEKRRRPYEEIAKKQKEEYLQEMELYNEKKDEEAAAHQKEEEEQMKIQKQEAMQMLKKKEKTENIIKKTKEKNKKKQKKVVVDPNKPKRPASSFILFSKEARKNLLQEERPAGINNSTLTALISVKWKELSEEDKKVWNDEAAEAMESYKKVISVKWKELSEEDKKVWNDEAAEAMESYKKELEEYNRSVAAAAAAAATADIEL